ncbi:MAG: hypothetical protein P4L51_24565 [Puia sp.]|nr:hypothetical protein [Puia sp.]
MKRLLYLFSLYILLLSGVPCSPDDECCREEINATALARQNSGHPDKTTDHKSGLPCSPLFPCGACSGIVIPDQIVQTVQPLPSIAKQVSLYTQRPLLTFTPAIWQPPKSA